ncbi:MAG: hypothetical protein R2685_13785 [Candidatus Nitrosocosmicus sp.]|nr:hypothetical protein [Candidatus Nitrosocosmicus sp.]
MFAAIASVLIAGIGMNSEAYALTRDGEFPVFGADDIGQSLKCVIVVVGCDGTGSVGSSGDTIIGSNNGNNGNNTNGNKGNGGGPQSCEECFSVLSETQLNALINELDLENESELCIGIASGTISAQALFDALTSDTVGVSVDVALDILDCLNLSILTA